MLRAEIEKVGTAVVDACVAVHRKLGPGLLEKAYQTCLTHELRSRGLDVDCDVALEVRYRKLVVPGAYRMDMIVENLVLLENKSVQSPFLPLHEAQLLTYLRLWVTS